MVHIHNEILLTHKKGEYLSICDSIDGTWACYAKGDKSDRERQILYGLTSMQNLKQTKHRYGEQIDGCHRQEVGDRQNG